MNLRFSFRLDEIHQMQSRLGEIIDGMESCQGKVLDGRYAKPKGRVAVSIFHDDEPVYDEEYAVLEELIFDDEPVLDEGPIFDEEPDREEEEPSNNKALALGCQALLEQARDAMVSGDGGATARALKFAERPRLHSTRGQYTPKRPYNSRSPSSGGRIASWR
jgi:hypothetical protein